MKRSAPLRRTARLRPVSRDAPTHRDCYTPTERTIFRSQLAAAYGWRCAVCQRARRLDPHHVVKRSQGGADGWENEIPVCRDCHDATDRPFCDERLVIQHVAGRRFRWARIRKADKWAPDPSDVVWTEIGPEA